MIWSVAALGWPDAAVPAVGILAGLAGREEVIQPEELLLPQIYTQLRLAMLAHDLVGGGSKAEDQEEWERLKTRLDRVWADGWREEVGDTTPSSLHLGVLSVLEGPLGAKGRCNVEVVDNKGAYILDIVIRPISSQSRLLPLVVEVDGPGHFLGPTRRMPNGPTAMKRLLLEAEVGKRWAAVVAVPYFDWNEAKGGGTPGLLSTLISRALVAQGLDPTDYIMTVHEPSNASLGTSTQGKTLKDLREKCRQIGLPISGTKKQLIDRLVAYQDSQTATSHSNSHSDSHGSTNKILSAGKRRRASKATTFAEASQEASIKAPPQPPPSN